MSNDSGWAIYWLLVGWMFAPLLLLPLVLIYAGWQRLFGPKSYVPSYFPDPEPRPPPEPLTDSELNSLLAKAEQA